MTRQPTTHHQARRHAIRQLIVFRATADDTPEHIARTTADRAERLYTDGNSAHRAITAATRPAGRIA